MFEFDPEKSNSNKLKHGIDFIDGQKLWDDPERLIIPAKTIDEKQYVLIGEIEGVFWSAIFSYRNQNIRIISIRKSRENEKDIYKSI